MLGFHPTNSLVLMCLSGGRRRVGPVARVDLPPGHDRALAAHLTSHALNHSDEVVVLCYQNSRRRPPLLDDLLAELARGGVDVMDAIAVRDGRARPALNAAMERAHPGIPIPDADDPQVCALTAAGALAGRSVLADREQLRRSIAGPTGKRLELAERGVDEAAAGRLPVPEHRTQRAESGADTADQRGPTDQRMPNDKRIPNDKHRPIEQHDPHTRQDIVLRIGPVPDAVTALVDQAMTQTSATGQVQVEVASALAVMLTDVLIRDAVLAQAIVEMDRPWLPMLIACATWTPDALAPPLCSVLAMVAYRHGDGALAQIAVDRCLVAEPDHRLAHLMIAIMSAGIRPEELERISWSGSPPTRSIPPSQASCGNDPVGRIL